MPDHAESFLLPMWTSLAHAVKAKTWRLNRIAKRRQRRHLRFGWRLARSSGYFGAATAPIGLYPQAAQKWLE
jgi:hypothetical protein